MSTKYQKGQHPTKKIAEAKNPNKLPYVGIPVADRTVVAQIDEADIVTPGGIIIPDSAKERPQRAKVLAVSSDCKVVQVGDVILYGSYSGVQLTINGIECIRMKELDIIVKNP